MHWRQPRMIFVCAHGDLFHPDVPDEWIDRVFAVMALCPQHIFQVLTKRPERMRDYMARRDDQGHHPAFTHAVLMALTGRWNTPELHAHDFPDLPNVWLGTSISDQTSARARIPALLNTPAAVRFVSAEPLLGSVFLNLISTGPGEYPGLRAVGDTVNALTGERVRGTKTGYNFKGPHWPKLDWNICGGESGRNARPMHPDWARGLRDQCVAAGVPFFFKQWGEWCPGENIEEIVSGIRQNATWWNNGWDFGHTKMDDPEDGWMDQIDMYRVGRKAAGRLLDGREWGEVPARD